jgi:hypothetical protein
MWEIWDGDLFLFRTSDAEQAAFCREQGYRVVDLSK